MPTNRLSATKSTTTLLRVTTNGCTSPGVAAPRELISPIPIEPTLDGALYPTAEEVETAVAANDQDWTALEIRPPRAGDLRGIVDVVGTCEPYLQAHISYIYWMNFHLFRETSAVLELEGEIVGYCSIMPAPGGIFFLHQLAVAPRVRRRGLAEWLLASQLNKLVKREPARFQLELTIDPRNRAALGLFRAVAERSGMLLLKKPDFVELLEEESKEELYVMTPVRRQRPLKARKQSGSWRKRPVRRLPR